MRHYEVVVIQKGREKDYKDFWIKNVQINTQGEELHSDLLSFVEIVEAKNRRDANALVKNKYPTHQIDDETTKKLG